MACTYPITAYELMGGQKTKNGKSVVVFKKPTDAPYQEIKIPCKQCLQCRIAKAKEWTVRIIRESELYKDNYFITLTYNDQSITKKNFVKVNMDPETGEILDTKIEKKATLVKKDITDFKKRLLEHFRKHKKHTGIRFFYCGEYGPQTLRPHYHMIMFNLPLDDLTFWRLNKQGQPIYRSKLVEEKWGMGNVEIGSVTYESAGYVARYVLKKQHITEELEGVEPEFIEMSTRPGIGRDYYEKNKNKIYKNDNMIIPKEFSNSYFTKPPKYFDELYDIEQPVAFYETKLKRRHSAQRARKVEEFNKNTSLNEREQAELKEREIARKMVNLKREL